MSRPPETVTGGRLVQVTAAEADMRLDRWFRLHFPDLPFTRLQRILRTGEVRVDGGRVKPGQRLAAGQQVRIPPLAKPPGAPDRPVRESRGETRAIPSPQDRAWLRSLILYEDARLIALNKPAGLAVQGGSGQVRHLDGLLDGLATAENGRPRLVHRLDRETSGVLLLARDRAAAAALALAFRNRAARKVYWAITAGRPPTDRGKIDSPLGKSEGGGQRMTADAPDTRTALTEYQVLDRAGDQFALVALRPHTGRTHQLRAHLASVGAPILGDGKYGGRAAFSAAWVAARGLHLHARSIRPDAAGPLITAPLPAHMAETLSALGLDPGVWLDADPFSAL